MDYFDSEDVETRLPFFRGGEAGGQSLEEHDIGQHIDDALGAALYSNVRPSNASLGFSGRSKVARIYESNQAFWRDAQSNRHFLGSLIWLKGFRLTEWVPFSPGRYYTAGARQARREASRMISEARDEYMPEGKQSMMRGGIGAVRLKERCIDNTNLYFLGASSSGIAHQGIPIALRADDYNKVVSLIKEQGGCSVNLIGRVQSVQDGTLALSYHHQVPRQCLFVQEISDVEACTNRLLLTTAAVMFSVDGEAHPNWHRYSPSNIFDKSWSFYSFHPGNNGRNVRTAAEWLLDYATRYCDDTPRILTDFDEQHDLFDCPVEFPLSKIVSGQINLNRLHDYVNAGGAFIETYIANVEKYSRNTFMRDQYNNSGQVGAMGANAQAHNNTFQQIQSQQGNIDLNQLVDELSKLRREMKRESADFDDPQHDIAISEVAKAEQAAKQGDGEKASAHLKEAGKFAFDVATKIGVAVAAKMIAAAAGF